MDDSKCPSAFIAAIDMEASLGGHGSIRAEPPEQIKRDLSSRHINMIAIAGMIVRSPGQKTHQLDETC